MERVQKAQSVPPFEPPLCTCTPTFTNGVEVGAERLWTLLAKIGQVPFAHPSNCEFCGQLSKAQQNQAAGAATATAGAAYRLPLLLLVLLALVAYRCWCCW